MHELVQHRATSGSVLIKANVVAQLDLGDDCMFGLAKETQSAEPGIGGDGRRNDR